MAPPVFFATPAQLRGWFEKHHATETSVSVGFYQRDSGSPSINWSESVDQALCFGWIDGVRHSIDGKRYRIRFTQRKPTSIWSAINIGKVKELTRLGQMTPAALAAFAKRSGIYAFEQRAALKLPAELEARLASKKTAAAYFAGQAPWYQRAATHWIVTAKREETRAKRLQTLIACSAAGRTVPPLTRRVAP